MKEYDSFLLLPETTAFRWEIKLSRNFEVLSITNTTQDNYRRKLVIFDQRLSLPLPQRNLTFCEDYQCLRLFLALKFLGRVYKHFRMLVYNVSLFYLAFPLKIVLTQWAIRMFNSRSVPFLVVIRYNNGNKTMFSYATFSFCWLLQHVCVKKVLNIEGVKKFYSQCSSRRCEENLNKTN